MKNRKLLIFVMIVFAVSVCLSRVVLKESEQHTVEVVQNGTVLYTFDLNHTEDEKIRISAPDGGYNLITISEGTVQISEADCSDQTCVKMGALRSDHLPIVCLPHRLIVRFAEDSP